MMNVAQNKLTYKVGFWFALAAFLANLGYGIVQNLQVIGAFKPPLDAILIYAFSIAIPIPFVVAMVALHYSVSADKRIWTHIALICSAIYTTYVTLNYTVQLTTVIPASLSGTLDPIRVLDQTPHSLFWDVDALGYIFLDLATLFASFAFANRGFEKWVKWFFLANALVTPIIGFVYFYPYFSYTVLLLAESWLITSLGSMLVMAIFFKRQIS